MGAPSPDLALVDAAFREGPLAVPAPPTRFYLNLTERCSLRCRHCLTQAPELTATGRARDLSAEVVEALRPHLRHAAYVGFPHAGEPLLAPALEPLLEALRHAREGAPTAVHLLTNGLALTEERFARLTRLGVNSWSVSLDGTSPGTNDALRLGARVEALLPRIAALAAARPAGVRLGLAWTVTRSNLPEIPGILDFAERARLDWIKLEEMFPHNPAARAEAVSAEEVRLRLPAPLSVPLLDHLTDRAVWKCRLGADPEMARFSRLDDLVNRMEINPCRLPFELVCVEPDGDLKPVSFHHPAGGNLLREGLEAAWNGPRFLEARAQARAGRLCGEGPATCAADPGPEAW